MAAQGVPARVAMKLLGHSQIATTMNVYTHGTPQDQREASARLSEAIWGKLSARGCQIGCHTALWPQDQAGFRFQGPVAQR